MGERSLSSINVDTDLIMKLEILRTMSDKESISVSELASELGLQDWEVFRMINELKNCYMINYVKGRILWFAGDNPARIRPWGWNYVYKVALGSTMVTAKHAPLWSVVISEWQYRGYGRHGKSWISNLGGIWATLKLEVSPLVAQMLPMIVSIIICRFLEERLDIKARIKWPNDVVVKGKKLAGFLIEAEVSLDRIVTYIGFGINVNNEAPLETAISIKDLLGKLVPRNTIIAYIAGAMGRIEDMGKNASKVQVHYLDYLETLGMRVRVVTRGGTYIGTAKSITENGDLVVETSTGSYRFSSGEVLELRHLE